ncbi:class IIb bacteriocin, lactobin A/cerein 7B family [Xylanibacter ruminicola]|uniref:Class IIb bacteriocin, lactobin A/cerein 7B family n=1 Tax=Xylanibacter ruminicola TaxID=839 RepID=A0A1M6YS90_XYLRU|nr:class IIb bacteriocin, lactobin A/cerein 7B family [Xylanibacter ruminicola]SHL20975.1 class IIb bacteriocin, lactobin A/cerein 7B family [Xylanibacter ruminicola]
MKQNEENIQKDQELTKEELEQVNGGISFQDPLVQIGEAL